MLVVQKAARQLLKQLPVLADRLVRNLYKENEAYGRGVVPHDDLRSAVHDNLRGGLSALLARPDQDLEAYASARRTGQRRAQQGLPLESLLHAYRLGGRVIWEALIEVVAADNRDNVPLLVYGATDVWNTIDFYSGVVADAYRETESALARRDGERVHALLDALLEGRATHGGVAASASETLELPEHGSYIVVIVRHDGVAPRSAMHLAQPESLPRLRMLWRARPDSDIGIVALADYDVDAFAATLEDLSVGPIGVSLVVDGLGSVGRARWLAEVALRTRRPGESGVIRLDQRLASGLVVSQPELSSRLREQVLAPVLALPAADRDVLLATLQAWLDLHGSAAAAAERLYCHRNTVFNRLRRLEQLTGRDLNRPRDVVELALALDADLH